MLIFYSQYFSEWRQTFPKRVCVLLEYAFVTGIGRHGFQDGKAHEDDDDHVREGCHDGCGLEDLQDGGSSDKDADDGNGTLGDTPACSQFLAGIQIAVVSQHGKNIGGRIG